MLSRLLQKEGMKMVKKISFICLFMLLFTAVGLAAGIAKEQDFNVNYEGINGEKLSFDYEYGASQVIVKSKMTKDKPIDMILQLKPAPSKDYKTRILSLRRVDVAGRSFWYLKAHWSGVVGLPPAQAQFWLIGQSNGKFVPYATERILGNSLTMYDTFTIVPAQAYRKTTSNGVFDPETIIAIDHFSPEFQRVDTTILYWDHAAQWFGYTGAYRYPYPIYVNGKKLN